MILYKYLKQEHAEAMLQRGSIRLGTLYEYRDLERHGAEVGDAKEGTKSFNEIFDEGLLDYTNQTLFSRQFFNIGLGAFIEISGTLTLTQNHEVPNFYVYSTTELFDEEALRKLGYDSCVVIDNHNAFFQIVSNKISSWAKYDGVQKCVYEDRVQSASKFPGYHPGILKDPIHAYQREIRAMWLPLQPDSHPRIIEIPEITEVCRLHFPV